MVGYWKIFVETSAHYLSELVRIKEKIFLSYLDKRVEVLPRLKKFKKFKKCKTISDFARIVYYERHKGKNLGKKELKKMLDKGFKSMKEKNAIIPLV